MERQKATMALQLLLETYAEVTSLKTIESAYIFEGKRITIVLLPHSVVLINVRKQNDQKTLLTEIMKLFGELQQSSEELQYSNQYFFVTSGRYWANSAKV